MSRLERTASIGELIDYLSKINSQEWIYGKENLSKYLGGMPISTIKDYEKAGLIKKHKFGKQCLYKKSEIDAAIIPISD